MHKDPVAVCFATFPDSTFNHAIDQLLHYYYYYALTVVLWGLSKNTQRKDYGID